MMLLSSSTTPFAALSTILVAATALQAAPSVRTNALGYETLGPKVAIAQDESAPGVTGFEVLDASQKTVYSGTPGIAQNVPGWAKMQFQTLDFSSLSDTGIFILRIQPSGSVSDTFRIGNARLFRTGAGAVVGFFNGMRNTSKDDRAIPYFGEESRGTHDVYGGWNDATGDQGKYLSHLSYANFMNPQQIPLVAWSLLRSRELAGDRAAGIDFLGEAMWGADYLLRVQDKAGYFYINVFNEGWSLANPRTICAWVGDAVKQGVPTKDYQAAWREGGGMSIAALALASRQSKHGDSTSQQYLAGAERGFAHLSATFGKWADDGRENMIDHMTALLAASELALATGKAEYATAAASRADSILARQQPDGWFHADGGNRTWYHAVDEGMPVVALARFLSVDSTSERADRVRAGIQANLGWYKKLTNEVANPFSYPRMWVPQQSTTPSGVGSLAKGRTCWASTVEKSGTEAANAFDGSSTTRWGASLQDSLGWLAVSLGDSYGLDSVAIVWEAAYGKKYAIQVSTDSTNWTNLAIDSSATGAGRRSFRFPDRPKARYVRMKGLVRASPYFSYSIYEFEVYGSMEEPVVPQKKNGRGAFFMPHENETGYWWQGENARLGSMATSFMLGMQSVSPLWRLNAQDTLSRMATAALDWITGSNPLGISFMHGFGPKNPPGYMGAENGIGGIANGITSSVDDSSTPEFMHYADGSDWKNWRWVEQWIPHDAWYLLGISSVVNSRERTIDVGVAPRISSHRKLDISRKGLAWAISAPGAVSIELRTLDGSVLAKTSGSNLSVSAPPTGLVLVVARGRDWQVSRIAGSVK